MAVKRWLNTRDQFSDSTGAPYSGGKLYFYTAGTTTPEDTFNDSGGGTANANPVVLAADGRPSSEIWLTVGTSYKVVLKTSADVTIWTEDNIDAVNDVTSNNNEWVTGPSATYVSATQFTVTGDQTAILDVGRRVKIADSGGTKYGWISATAYTTLTTVTITGDSLASSITSLEYGLLSSVNPSDPAHRAFPATQVSSSDANTLDDYQENAWTPVLKFGGGNTGMSIGWNATETKVGREVHVTLDLTVNTVGSSTGNATVEGLTHANAAGHTVYGKIVWRLMGASFVDCSFSLADGATTLTLFGITAANASADNNNLTHASFNPNSEIHLEFSYPAAT